MLTRKEKEELVIKLLQEGKTYKEIAKEAHVSLTLIGSLRKKIEGDDNQPSIRNRAYRMFEDKKQPIDVAIAFNIDDVETMKYYTEYLHLKREYEFLKIRNELKGEFVQFVNLFEEMKSKYYSIDDIKEALGIVRNTNIEVILLSNLEHDKQQCQEEVDKLNQELKKLSDEISGSTHQLDGLESFKRLLLVNVKSLIEEKIYIEKQLNQMYDSNYLMNNQLISNSISISGKIPLT